MFPDLNRKLSPVKVSSFIVVESQTLNFAQPFQKVHALRKPGNQGTIHIPLFFLKKNNIYLLEKQVYGEIGRDRDLPHTASFLRWPQRFRPVWVKAKSLDLLPGL